MPKGAVSHRQTYLEKQELLRKNKIAAGLVSERFPNVTEIVLRMTYFQQAANPVLMVRTVNFSPGNYAYFHMECMREGCTNGGFDLTPVVAGLVKSRTKTAKGKIICKGKNESVAPGHASIAYEVVIQSAKGGK